MERNNGSRKIHDERKDCDFDEANQQTYPIETSLYLMNEDV